MDQSFWSDRRHYSVIMEESPEEVAAALAEDEWDQVETDEAWAVRLDSPPLPLGQPHAQHGPHTAHVGQQQPRTFSNPYEPDRTIVSVDTSDSISEELVPPPPWNEWVPNVPNPTKLLSNRSYDNSTVRTNQDVHPLLPSRIPTLPHFPTLPSLTVLPPAVEDNPFVPLAPYPSPTTTQARCLFGPPRLLLLAQPIESTCSTPLAPLGSAAQATFASPDGADLSPSCFAGPDGLWSAI